VLSFAPMSRGSSPAGAIALAIVAGALGYAAVVWWLWPGDLEAEAHRRVAAEAPVSVPPAARSAGPREERARIEAKAPGAIPGVAETPPQAANVPVAASAPAAPDAPVANAPAPGGGQAAPLPAPVSTPTAPATMPPRVLPPPPPPGYTGPVDPFADDPYAGAQPQLGR
jgi:hypothetical protein